MPPAALLVALALAGPTLWGAVVDGAVPVDLALQRLLLILVATMFGWSVVHRLVAGFARTANARQAERAHQVRQQQGRRRHDVGDGDPAQAG